MESKTVRLSFRVSPQLAARVQKAAAKKRWSLSVYLEEAIIEKLAYEEPVKK